MQLSCAYHRPAQVQLVSLRDFSGQGLAQRRRSQAAVAVAERSDAAFTPAGSEGLPSGSAPGPPPANGVHLLHQMSTHQCNQVTQHVLRAFLPAGCHNGAVKPAEQDTTAARTWCQRSGVQPQQQRQCSSAMQQLDGQSAGEVSLMQSSDEDGNGSSNDSSNGSSSSNVQGCIAHAGSQEESPPRRQRGLQGQVVEHLLAGGFDEVLLESVPTHTLNWVVKVLGQQGSVQQAEELFHWMRVKGKANQFSLVKMFEACGAARQPWRALQVWRNTWRMPQARHVAGTQAAAALVLSYRSTGDHRGAMAALKMMVEKGFPVDRYAYNAAIRVCADAGAADDALRLLRTLRQLAKEAQQEQPGTPAAASSSRRVDSSSGGSQHSEAAAQAVAGGRTSGRWPTEAAQQGEQEASGGGMRTDCRSYSAALAAMAAGGKFNRAGQLHRWLIEDGVQPDAPLCAQLLSCYAAVGQAAAAQQLVDAMLADSQLPPNRTHWNTLLLAYATAQDATGCAAAYRSMLAAGVRPDGYTMLALLRAAFHTGQGLAAVQAVQRELVLRQVALNRQLGTAMLCCLRHVRPIAPSTLQLELDAQAQPAASGSQRSRKQQRRRQPKQAAAAAPKGCELVSPAAQRPLQEYQELQDGHATTGTSSSTSPAGNERQQQVQGIAKQPGQKQGQEPAARQSPIQRGAQQAAEAPASYESQACLVEAASLFRKMRKQARKLGQPLDLRAYNSLLLVQLAAGDHEGVLRTFEELEAGEELLPDATTLGVVISACQAAGWQQRERQYRQLLVGSRLLGTLGGDEEEGLGGGGSSRR